MLFKLCLSKSVLKHLLLLALGVKAWLFLRRSLPPSSPKTHPPSPMAALSLSAPATWGFFSFSHPPFSFSSALLHMWVPLSGMRFLFPPFSGWFPFLLLSTSSHSLQEALWVPIKADLPTARLAPCPAPVREVHHSSNYWFGDDSKFSESKNLSFFF